MRLIGVHNRPHGLFDLGNPLRELDDPPITAAFAAALDRLAARRRPLPQPPQPRRLADRPGRRARAARLLHDPQLLADLPARLPADRRGLDLRRPGRRRALRELRRQPRRSRATGAGWREIRARAHAGLTADPGRLRRGPPHAARRRLRRPSSSTSSARRCRTRPRSGSRSAATAPPGRVGEQLTVAFLGSAYPHKGPQLLSRPRSGPRRELDVRILGEVPGEFAEQLRALDRRGVVELDGAFAPSEIGGLLRDVDAVVLPSMWWDCAPLAAAECLAARVPLVVPRLGGLAEAVRDGVDGLIFDALDADDLARQLDRARAEPGLLERLQDGDRGAARRSPPTSTSSRPTTPATRPALRSTVAACAPSWRRPLAGRPRAPDQPVDHQRPRHRAAAGPGAAGARATARRSTRPSPTPPTSRSATSGRRTSAAPAPGAWRRSCRGSSARSRATGLPQIDAQRRRAVGPERVRPRDVPRRRRRRRARARRSPTASTWSCSRPDERAATTRTADRDRFLFVGGLIWRKGPDVLLEAWTAAFAGRDDVTLVIKDFGADGVYRGADRERRSARTPSPARCRGSSCSSDDLDERPSSPRCTARATCSSTRTAARASRCRCSRRWRAGCR